MKAHFRLHPNAQKQQMLDQMQAGEDLDKRIRGTQRDKHEKHEKQMKHQRSEIAKYKRVSFKGTPNDASDSDPDINMDKRKARSDGESQPDQGSKRSRSDRSGWANAYDSPSNMEFQKHHNLYETGYIGDKEPKKGKGKGKQKGYGENKGGKAESKGKGAKYFFPAPDCDDPIVKMQTPMEICKLKGERKITMEVSMAWFAQMRNAILLGKGDAGALGNPRVMEECAKKTLPLYAQSWLARGSIANAAKTTEEESEEIKDRKSYLLKIKELLFDLRKCEVYPTLSGYQETKSWFGDKMTFAIHGNPGCDIWFRQFVDLSKTGRVWELNEEGRHLKGARIEEDYRQLARRFGRYKRARADALGEIRYEQTTENAPDKFIGWKQVQKRVIEKREKE